MQAAADVDKLRARQELRGEAAQAGRGTGAARNVSDRQRRRQRREPAQLAWRHRPSACRCACCTSSLLPTLLRQKLASPNFAIRKMLVACSSMCSRKGTRQPSDVKVSSAMRMAERRGGGEGRADGRVGRAGKEGSSWAASHLAHRQLRSHMKRWNRFATRARWPVATWGAIASNTCRRDRQAGERGRAAGQAADGDPAQRARHRHCVPEAARLPSMPSVHSAHSTPLSSC